MGGRWLKYGYYDEPTWLLLSVIAVELVVVIVLLGVLVAR